MDPKDIPQLQYILSDRKKVEQLVNSSQARSLAKLLSQRKGEGALEQAAQQAAQGNTQPLSELVRAVTESPQGAQLLRALQQALEEK